MKTRTYAMIKPDAMAAGHAKDILARIGKEGFSIAAQKEITIERALAEKFYEEHKGKPFFEGLVAFISSGPVTALILEKDNAVSSWRELIGATNPADAAENTLRKLYAISLDNNAVHGSDAADTAQREIALIFPELV
ncbi:nucleoside-diphosphate kinase [Candidatus Babeliales bacterium]|nr:nucleoside-diphosphate kinase [Candidatus Babeliales bacterium]